MGDIRDIDPPFYYLHCTDEEVEWYKKPTQFKHFKNRIDLLSIGLAGEPLYKEERDFYNFLKYRILNLIPTKNIELTEKVYNYLSEKYGKKKLERIIRKCATYRIERDEHE